MKNVNQKQKFNEDYYLGLDLGTSSVGWAVTDSKYNILRFNKKDMWGSRLFDEANTAEERRIQRNARRRLKRRKWRLDLLERIFIDEVSKKDPTFFMRLKESNLYLEDKSIDEKFTLFNDVDYKDKDFYTDYPTIYHLRHELMIKDEKKDIRLIYLALHNIFKRRGHFLSSGLSMDEIKNFSIVFNDLKESLEKIFEITIDVDGESIKNILTNDKNAKKDKESKLNEIFNKNSQLVSLFKLVIGSKVNFKNIFIENEALKEKETEINISFSDIIYDEKRDEFYSLLGDDIEIIDKCKNMFDYLILTKILKNSSSISKAMVDSYNEHKKDLGYLKGIIRKYCKEKYNKIFRNSGENYSAYISSSKTSQEELIKSIESIIKNIKDQIEQQDKESYDYICKKIEDKTLLKKQRSTDNVVLPYQVHKYELMEILKKQSKYYDFLKNKAKEIEATFEFRIPYYVGPLNNHSKNAWVEREKGEITPQNFEEKINLEKSAENFILRMTNKCTYLRSEDVLPKNSLLYSEYTVLNELNKVKINGSSDIILKYKQEIIDSLFKIYSSVTVKKLINFLETKQIFVDKDEISGVSQKFNSSLQTYIKFRKIFGSKIEEDKYKNIVENAIRWKCLYGDDKKIFEKKFKREYNNNEVTEKEFKEISKLNFNGWGKLCEKLLTNNFNFINNNTGEGPYTSIMEALRTTNLNLMELLSSNFNLSKKIEEENNQTDMGKTLTYKQLVDISYISPSVKRSVIQTIKIINEIKKITGKQPKKIFIETARGGGEKGKRTISRKNTIANLYKSVKKESDEIFSNIDSLNKEVDKYDNNKLRQKKLFLYFMQLGKCMYSGEKIDISSLNDGSKYDIEHIYPQSKVKDDSFDNIILVKKELNIEQKDNYPKSKQIRDKMERFWKILKDKKFISGEKYSRLICEKPLTADQLSGFVARQLVATRQATVEVIRILNMIYPESEIIYSKAENVSDFREKFELIKSRELNDMHHAKDAYLNIVVGSVYNAKFTKNPSNFIKEQLKTDKKESYNFKKIFDYDIRRNNELIWDKENTKDVVIKNINKNTVNITRMLVEDKGQLFDLTIKKKTKGKTGDYVPAIKINGESQKLAEKYGYYDSMKASYFVFLDYDDKKGRKKTVDRVLIKDLSKIKTDEDLVKYFEVKYKNPRIIRKIKKQQLILLNNYPYRITGFKNSSGLELKNAKSMFLDDEYIKYLKDSVRFAFINEKNNEDNYIFPKIKRKTDKEKPETNDESKVRHEKEFNKLYDILIDKLESKEYAYYYLKSYANVLIGQKEIFYKNSLLEKAKMINRIIKILNKDTNWLFKGASKEYPLKLTESRIFSHLRVDKLIFVDESVTGLFNKKEVIE